MKVLLILSVLLGGLIVQSQSVPVAGTNPVVRPLWMTNAPFVAIPTNVLICWPTKKVQIWYSTNNLDWMAKEIDVTNYGIMPIVGTQMFFKVATGFTSNENVLNQSKVTWQTGTVVTIKTL